jgi:predicted transcriptional regulator
MRVQRIETLLAIKAISIVPGLTESDRQVGIALIEHFNRDSGRCDPSLDRLAKITGLSTRTVMRALKRLTAAGLFWIRRHGGYSNRNSYEPMWHRFEAIRNTWQARFSARSRSRAGRKVSPSMCQPEAKTPDAGVTQTYCKDNLLNATYLGRPTEGMGTTPSAPNPPAPRNPFSPAPSEAARTAAERRWSEALRIHFVSDPVAYGEAIHRIDQDLRLAATEAELRRRGQGLLTILRRLRDPSNDAGNAGGTP